MTIEAASQISGTNLPHAAAAIPPETASASEAGRQAVTAATAEKSSASVPTPQSLPSLSTNLDLAYHLATGRLVQQILDRQSGAPLASYPTPMMLMLYEAAARGARVANLDLTT